MPLYQYECQNENCKKEWSEHLQYEESPDLCPYCKQKDFKKVYRYTTMINKLSDAMEHRKNQKTGTKTRNFIEESRKELEEQKEAMRGK